MQDLIKNLFNLHYLNGVRLLLVHLKLLTVAELVVLHIDEPVFQFSGVTWGIALQHHGEAVITSTLQELILVCLVSQVLRVLCILSFLFVKSYLACLVDRERNLLRVFNNPAPLVMVGSEPLKNGWHASA